VTGTDLAVLVGAAAAIGWVNWYFFVGGRTAPAVAAAAADGAAVPEVVITVDGGYSPSVVQARAGVPLRLVFDRRDDSSCSEEIVMPAFGVRRFLPSGERTIVEFTPPPAGRYPFTCGMGMLRGTVVVDD
jgi:plastocyanin domain-containing protein